MDSDDGGLDDTVRITPPVEASGASVPPDANG